MGSGLFVGFVDNNKNIENNSLIPGSVTLHSNGTHVNSEVYAHRDLRTLSRITQELHTDTHTHTHTHTHTLLNPKTPSGNHAEYSTVYVV